jgi:lipid II:glycine glycyltransferase (peptidoglycan interpeptide bridge formation enzyme)
VHDYREIQRTLATKTGVSSTPELRRPVRTAVPYSTRETKNVTRAEWDGWLRDSPGGGHVLQSYEWGEFKRTSGWRPIRLVLQRNGEVAGVGQFLSYDTGPFVPGALWYCTKGPWLPWDDEEAIRAFFRGVREMAGREGAHTIKIEPEVFDGVKNVGELLGEIGFRKARYDLNQKTTLVVDLSTSEEELLAKMKGKTRYNVRLADRKGVEVVEPEFEEGWATFYGFMKDTADRAGYPIRRSQKYLHDNMRDMHAVGRGNLFFATYEGTPLAGIYVYTFGKKCWYIHGGSSNEKRNLMPTYLLQWGAMRWARQLGLTYYDMVGVPRPENLNEGDSMWGVYRFKAGFGGEITDFLGCLDLPVKPMRAAAWYRFEPIYYRLYQKLKHEVFY